MPHHPHEFLLALLLSAADGCCSLPARATHVAVSAPSRSTVDSLCLAQLKESLKAEWRIRLDRAEPNALGGCEAADWASRSLHATRLANVPLNRCHLAESTIPDAGRGVFASCDLVAGDLVTLYPGDAIRIDATLFGYNHVSCCSAAEDGALVIPDASLLSRARDYEIEVATPTHDADRPPLTALLGDPLQVNEPAYLGHMLNDAAVCSTELMADVYAAESARTRNVEPVGIEGCHLAILATRNVRQGEELFLTYGAPYWLAQLGNAHSGDMLTDNDEQEGKRGFRGDRRQRRPWHRKGSAGRSVPRRARRSGSPGHRVRGTDTDY